MTEIQTYADAAKHSAGNYTRCDTESALCYAIEGIVETVHGWRVLTKTQLGEFVDLVCEAEGLDQPQITHLRKTGNVIATAYLDCHALEFRGGTMNVGSVLHEIAHLSAGSGAHGSTFRNEYLRLVRRHGSVEHAAFLHAVFGACGLTVTPWQALG